MPIAVQFTPKSMTRAQYDQILERLDIAGAGAPSGRLHHACYEADGALCVMDIWESPETFQAFGATLMPILGDLGVDPGEPVIRPIYRVI